MIQYNEMNTRERQKNLREKSEVMHTLQNCCKDERQQCDRNKMFSILYLKSSCLLNVTLKEEL